MVIRLGSSNGTGTQFSVVKVKDRLHDFFLIDKELFSKYSSPFYPTTDPRNLISYEVLKPNLTETSMVNLSFASGLLARALNITNGSDIVMPATGRSTFTFKLKPHSSLNDILIHNNGQVEIDSIFVGKRNGQDHLFVLEAKSGATHKSLSKHKLVYPILAIAQKVSTDMPIVPVYMKIFKIDEKIHYHIVECSFPDPRQEVRAIDELVVKNYSHLILEL